MSCYARLFLPALSLLTLSALPAAADPFVVQGAQCASPVASARATSTDTTGKGRLLIIGGGAIPASVVQRLITLAGGPDSPIVIFPHASGVPAESAEATRALFAAQGAKKIEIYACKSGAMDTAPCLAQLAKAGGIFFTGGDQNLLTKALMKTKAFERIQALWRGGAVVSGTSAGAAIMSEVMITGEEQRQAGEAESAPFSSIRKGRVLTAAGLGFVNRYLIDQHFVIRMRQNRLISAILDHPHLIGVGIDESTAIVVEPDQSFEVVGDATVLVVDPREAKAVEADSKAYYSARNLKMHLLTAGDRFMP